jgi:riboflavin kinase/FMN adenylyltransferase
MEVVQGHGARTRNLRKAVVAIGNFDGVHVGHKALVAEARRRADERGGEVVVLTFEPHPARVLAPHLAPPLLVSLPRKLELLEAAGVDVTVVEPFTPALAATSAEAFVDDLLVSGLGATHVVVGYDFTYGQKRSGTIESLRAAGERRGFGVSVVPAVTVDGLVASSTKVREFVLEGNVEGARALLARDFDVDGVVVRGAGRGRTIGVPTANVAAETQLLPRPGVYAGRLMVLGEPRWHGAAVNLGSNPTFVEAGTLSLEAHVLDFSGDLYDRRVRVAFVARIRDEQRFSAIDRLIEQIRRDIDTSRSILERHG